VRARRPTLRLAPLVLAALAASPASARDFSHPTHRPVGVTTLPFATTSVTTGAPRPLPTVVWYPAVPGTGTPEELGLRDATVRRGRHPLVVFSHGTCGRPTETSYLTRALASRGFVVAAPPHPGNTADDGIDCLSAATAVDSAANRVPDVRAVLDGMLAEAARPGSPFRRRIRTRKVAIAGLSFGGFTTLRAAQEEPRFRAALALVPGGGTLLHPEDIAIPTMIQGGERDTVTGIAEAERAFERVAAPRFLVEVLGAGHLAFTDECGILCAQNDIPQDASHELVLRYAVPFLLRYLKGSRAAGRALGREVPGVVLDAEPRRR
jgi:predicted dienelactone hydrolase